MNAIDQSNEVVWHVQVEAGDVRVWTIDQLDAAFKVGLVCEETYVLEAGTTSWSTLGELLGGDDEPEAPPPVAAAPAPVSAQSYVPQSLAPQAYTPSSFAPQSIRPMVSDIDLDEHAPFRSSKKRGVVITLALALAIGGAGFAARGRIATAMADAPPPPVVVAAAPVQAAPPPPVAPAAPTMAAAGATPDGAGTSSPGWRLTEEQKRKLAEIDKAREVKLQAQQKSRAATVTRRGKKVHEKQPFHEGGNQYDPLNGKL